MCVRVVSEEVCLYVWLVKRYVCTYASVVSEVIPPGFPRRISIPTAQKLLHELGFEVLNTQGKSMSKEGYWTSDKFLQQMEKAVKIADVKYPKSEGYKITDILQ